MKFGARMQRHMTPEWRTKYLQYDELKEELVNFIRSPDYPAQLSSFEATFFEVCEEELTKINLFYKERMAKAEATSNAFHRAVSEMKEIPQRKRKRSQVVMKLKWRWKKLTKTAPSESFRERKTLEDLKFGVSEFYYSLILIQNYQELNRTGFRKILKKHDKKLHVTSGANWMTKHVVEAEFSYTYKIQQLIKKTEELMTRMEGDNRAAAMTRLRVPPLSDKESHWTTFRLGLFAGSFLVLLSLVLKGAIDVLTHETTEWVGIRLFRGWIILFAHVVLVGLNVFGWRRNGVNHVLIFEVDPRSHLTYQNVMEIGLGFCCLWALSLLAYLHADTLNAPALLFPLLLLGLSLLWLFNPINVCYRSSRFWLLRRLRNCLFPFPRVQFADFWIGDQLVSMVAVFLDIQYSVCFYATSVSYNKDTLLTAVTKSDQDLCNTAIYGIRPLVSLVPSLIRIGQCLRRLRGSKSPSMHLANAFKYSTSILVVFSRNIDLLYRTDAEKEEIVSNVFFWYWLWALFISFAAMYTWDICMDWGLLRPNQKGLRKETIYSTALYYYLAMVGDGILRLSWVFSISLGVTGTVTEEVMICVTCPLECFRRFVWNFFRLENEHLNNCGEFRAHRDIGIKVINEKDLLEERESEEDEEQNHK